MNVGIITVSDRASSGEYEDHGGPALQAEADKRKWTVKLKRGPRYFKYDVDYKPL